MAPVRFSFSPIGFGAFKIGRTEGAKYPHAYELPDRRAVEQLLNGILDLGVNYIDTAPAYGLSEERIGQAISHRRKDFLLSTKVGEIFTNGRSRFDFSEHGVRNSLQRSLSRLRTDVIDLVLIHSGHDDLSVLRETCVVPTLLALRETGLIRAIGLSGYSAEAFRESLAWADAIMVPYHVQDASLAPIMQEAHDRQVMVIVKKGLASGRLAAPEAIRFVLATASVATMVVGTLSLDHMRENLTLAREIRGKSVVGETPAE